MRCSPANSTGGGNRPKQKFLSAAFLERQCRSVRYLQAWWRFRSYCFGSRQARATSWKQMVKYEDEQPFPAAGSAVTCDIFDICATGTEEDILLDDGSDPFLLPDSLWRAPSPEAHFCEKRWCASATYVTQEKAACTRVWQQRRKRAHSRQEDCIVSHEPALQAVELATPFVVNFSACQFLTFGTDLETFESAACSRQHATSLTYLSLRVRGLTRSQILSIPYPWLPRPPSPSLEQLISHRAVSTFCADSCLSKSQFCS